MMSEYVVFDTDVFSYIFNGQDPKGHESHLKTAIPVLAFTTVGELIYGANKVGWGEQKMARLNAQISRFLIAPCDEDLARLWGELKAQAVKAGHPLGQAAHTNDLWICTTAIYYDAPLLTNNTRHYENFPGLHLL